eukprot:TRINITY_DN1185_c0_g1_i4.p1 TRINITY_DN1185_c0_g1~~TRINITY_DN1185_c0_g1_i4.p1  ORF type:complete len:1391 (-),score=514.02 TRINITY_DN1185_c0_g1_i4:837-4736(-)
MQHAVRDGDGSVKEDDEVPSSSGIRSVKDEESEEGDGNKEVKEGEVSLLQSPRSERTLSRIIELEERCERMNQEYEENLYALEQRLAAEHRDECERILSEEKKRHVTEMEEQASRLKESEELHLRKQRADLRREHQELLDQQRGEERARYDDLLKEIRLNEERRLSEERDADAEMHSRAISEAEKSGYSNGYKEGYNDGYSRGERVGYDEGHSVGIEEGMSEGEKSGYSNGYKEGYNDGYSRGERVGYDEGHSVGIEEGMSEGEKSGYSNGYEACRAEKDDEMSTALSTQERLLLDRCERESKESYRRGHEKGFEEGVISGRDECTREQSEILERERVLHKAELARMESTLLAEQKAMFAEHDAEVRASHLRSLELSGKLIRDDLLFVESGVQTIEDFICEHRLLVPRGVQVSANDFYSSKSVGTEVEFLLPPGYMSEDEVTTLLDELNQEHDHDISEFEERYSAILLRDVERARSETRSECLKELDERVRLVKQEADLELRNKIAELKRTHASSLENARIDEKDRFDMKVSEIEDSLSLQYKNDLDEMRRVSQIEVKESECRGFSCGVLEGKSAGYEEGYSDGYEVGRKDGIAFEEDSRETYLQEKTLEIDTLWADRIDFAVKEARTEGFKEGYKEGKEEMKEELDEQHGKAMNELVLENKRRLLEMEKELVAKHEEEYVECASKTAADVVEDLRNRGLLCDVVPRQSISCQTETLEYFDFAVDTSDLCETLNPLCVVEQEPESSLLAVTPKGRSRRSNTFSDVRSMIAHDIQVFQDLVQIRSSAVDLREAFDALRASTGRDLNHMGEGLQRLSAMLLPVFENIVEDEAMKPGKEMGDGATLKQEGCDARLQRAVELTSLNTRERMRESIRSFLLQRWVVVYLSTLAGSPTTRRRAISRLYHMRSSSFGYDSADQLNGLRARRSSLRSLRNVDEVQGKLRDALARVEVLELENSELRGVLDEKNKAILRMELRFRSSSPSDTTTSRLKKLQEMIFDMRADYERDKIDTLNELESTMKCIRELQVPKLLVVSGAVMPESGGEFHEKEAEDSATDVLTRQLETAQEVAGEMEAKLIEKDERIAELTSILAKLRQSFGAWVSDADTFAEGSEMQEEDVSVDVRASSSPMARAASRTSDLDRDLQGPDKRVSLHIGTEWIEEMKREIREQYEMHLEKVLAAKNAELKSLKDSSMSMREKSQKEMQKELEKHKRSLEREFERQKKDMLVLERRRIEAGLEESLHALEEENKVLVAENQAFKNELGKRTTDSEERTRHSAKRFSRPRKAGKAEGVAGFGCLCRE